MVRVWSAVALVLVLVSTRASHAASVGVSSGCSLSNAIASLNAGANRGGCVIVGSLPVTAINVPSGTFSVPETEVTPQRSFTLSGAGKSTTTLQFTGGTLVESGLYIPPGISVTIKNLTMRSTTGGIRYGLFNGGAQVSILSARFTGYGCAAIVNNGGTTSLDKSNVDNNGSRRPLWGGGIQVNAGEVRLDDTSVTNNRALRGGGIYVYTPGSGQSLYIGNSLIANNIAEEAGGGIYLIGQMEAHNTTISSNRAGVSDKPGPGNGGGIFHDSGSDELHLYHCTITQNTAKNAGGGMYIGQVSGPAIFGNIIAGNVALASYPDVVWQAPPSSSTSYNLVQTTTGWDSSVFPLSAGNKVGVNPNLESLQNRGGPTSVHPIPSTSPACNAMPSSIESEDQRGSPRPGRGPKYDMGAFEVQ